MQDAAGAGNREPKDGGDTRILLVEDEDLTRELIAAFLEEAGYDVTATRTADEAAILLAEDGYALLLTDITVPGQIDGIGLAEHAREIRPGLPIVFASGREDMRQRACAVSAPVDFFAKPYDVATLVRAVARMVESAT